MKKSFGLLICLILLLSNLAFDSAQALNIAPMTWTSGRSDWINVMTNTNMTIHAVGNGTNDDTAALQQALNLASAPASKQLTVYLPPGTYKITSTLYWSTNYSSIQAWGGAYGVNLVGCGSNTTIEWAGPAGEPMLLDQGSSRSHYEGIVWDGTSPGSSTYAGFGVAHVSLAYYQTRMRHENEAFENFEGTTVGTNTNEGTISPAYVYTHTTGTVSTSNTLPSGVTVLPLASIPSGLVVGAGISGTGIVTGTWSNGSPKTTTTVTAISTSPPTVTISAATNHTVGNGTVYNFTSSVAGTPETAPATAIFAGSKLSTSPMAETMIWNCLFQNDATGVMVGYEEYNNYMWIFKNCEFDNCGTGINGGDGKPVIMDTHFSGSTTADVTSGVITRLRRCTSSGSKQFFVGPDTGAELLNVIEDCWVDSWTNTTGAISFNDRGDMVFDSTFTHPPSGASGDIYMWPGNPLDLTLSNNYTSSTTVPITYVRGGTVNTVDIPSGALISNVTSPNQTFLQSTWAADGPTILDITQSPYNAVRGTDCTAAIQSAINQAKANNNGTIVYIPAGTFDVGVSTTSNTTLDVSGGNYTIEGSGWGSQLYWDGSASTTVPMFTVSTPDNIAIEQLQLTIGATSGISYQPCISETSTGACSATYDEDSSGGYTNSPGIVLTSLPAGSTVFMPFCDSALTMDNCGAANIFFHFMLGAIWLAGMDQAPTGFTGGLSSETGQGISTSGWDLTINDNQSFFIGDLYNEQTYNHLLAENTHEVTWTGNIAFQGMKEESDAPSTTIDINDFGGDVFYGMQGFEDNDSQPQFIQSGSNEVNLILIGDAYYSDPYFSLGDTCNLIEANDTYGSPSETYMDNIEPTGWGAAAAAGLDHFRQADAYDLLHNYGLEQYVSNTSFETDAANPDPTTEIGYNPADWTVGGSIQTDDGARNCTVVTTASPFGPGTQGLLWVDSSGSTTGTQISLNQSWTAPATTTSEVETWSFDVQMNSSANNTDCWIRTWANAGALGTGALHLTCNGTTFIFDATIGGVSKVPTFSPALTPAVNTWYHVSIAVPMAGGNATLYVTPWTSTGPGTTSSATIDGASSAATSGINRIYFDSAALLGKEQSMNLDNITVNNSPVIAQP